VLERIERDGGISSPSQGENPIPVLISASRVAFWSSKNQRREENRDFKMSLNTAKDYTETIARNLADFNYSLEHAFSVISLNEKFLEQKIDELERIGPINGELHCLTFARLNELALICAGNYADNFECAAAGDLLVNPRLILVHIKRQIRPVIKKRHSRLTEQFRNVASTRSEVIQWLKKETLLEIKKAPLLPYLYESLKKSGYMSREYLLSADRRMKRIADVVVLLCSLHLPDSHEFHQWLQYTTQSERQFIKSRLCQFDTRTFYDLGYDIHQIIQGKGYKSRFLRQSAGLLFRHILQEAITA
jgi:hypothetical protein